MIAEERRALLIQKLNENGYIEISGIASELNVTGTTLRRDLVFLEKEGLCSRVRGGAIRRSQGVTHELPYDVKKHHNLEEKKRIGEKAAKYVQPGDTIILDAGSTTYALALSLQTKKGITVVTNDLHIAVKLASNPDITLICTGGKARSHVFTLEGSHVETFIKEIHVDKTFLGADAIHPDLSVFNVNLEEVPIKQSMVNAAKKVFLIADSSKFEKTGFAKVCNLSENDTLITDRGITQKQIDKYKRIKVDVVIA